ncbi:MAG TPA: efflux RND transporter periplasmic adaptor subunit [Anaerolineales bacterium]|nr:efflux RND transporter periplasmic adaptor subunit [Anaerolineales bacterium]
MNHKRPPLPAIIVVVLLLVVSAYFIVTQALAEDNGALTASGTIEGTIVNISPEISGKVKEVLVEEGQSVKLGDPVLVLDDSLLTAQRAVAVSQLDAANAGVQSAQEALKSAQSQYQITLEAALAQGKSSRLDDWFSDPDLFAQPGWYYTREEQVQAMQAQVDLAHQKVEEAQANLDEVSRSLDKEDFLKAEQRMLEARLSYLIAKDVNNQAQNSATRDTPKGLFNRTHCGTNRGYFVESARLTNILYKCTGDEHLGDAGRTLYDEARDELEDAQKAYDILLDTEAADVVLEARAEVSVALERYYSALDRLRDLQTGDQAVEVTAAQGVVDQAKAAVEQAQKAVEQAQANLDLTDTQLAKINITAPMDGIILTRNVETGEFVQPGTVAFGMADLNNITITVFVPEDRYGKISLGQQAEITVDSFSGETFTGEVIHMADQAEFTPRNVQTVEGRSSTVYAIKLKVTDSEGKLKIGMPADVVFK